MNAQKTNVARIGFDLRGLIALTSVAALVALISKVDLGLAAVLGAVFIASALMAHAHPVGSPSRHRAMGFVFLIGIVCACLAVAVQFFIFGNRIYLMWGTALSACIATGVGAAALCKPAWLRWSTRFLITWVLIIICYLTVHCCLFRDSILLSLRHDAYFLPRFAFTQEGGLFDQNWVLNRLRASVGLTQLFSVEFQRELTASDWNALFNSGSMGFVRFSGCTIDLPTDPLPQSKLDSVQFSSCELQGQSLGTFAAASNSTMISLEKCRVVSFEGLSDATSLQWIVIQDMPITDEFIGELLKLPMLQGISLDHAPISEIQLKRIRAERSGMTINIQ